MQNFAVIFDFNGTMLFDTPVQYQAWNMVAQKTLGHELDLQTFLRESNGQTSTEIVHRFWGSGVTEQQRQTLIAQKRNMYRDYYVTHPEELHLAEGLPKLLDLLLQHHIPFTIATSSDPISVDFYFQHLKLERWFCREKIVCNNKQFPGKPAPDIYLHSAQSLQVLPEQCIVVEDAMVGVLAARRAGIGYIVLIDEEHAATSRICTQADLVIHSFDTLYQLIDDKIIS